MATIEAAPESHAHGEHDHDHPAFLAHHFDTPEQQFDSGKLGMWIFLVTEVLFFSGMFCAYAVYRMLRPEVFEGCSQFLNTQLGAINTGVLLFSSLTMAWAVRCAQTEEHKKLTALLATTLSCGMIFLGVKAIEYSHKWSMGLLPAGLYFYNPANPHPEGGPNYLFWLCLPFGLLTIGTVIWLITALAQKKPFSVAVAKPLVVVCLCFFVGVGLGTILESGEEGGHEAGEHAAAHVSENHASEEHAEHAEAAAGEANGEGEQHVAAAGAALDTPSEGPIRHPDVDILHRLAAEPTNVGVQSELTARERQTELAGSMIVTKDGQLAKPIDEVPGNVLTPRTAGVFFGIYYCMTGIHAIHILAGLGVLVWLLVRSIRLDFNRQYFGPVDYVGLYWHLVDLIWIYLFPLLYLIR